MRGHLVLRECSKIFRGKGGWQKCQEAQAELLIEGKAEEHAQSWITRTREPAAFSGQSVSLVLQLLGRHIAAKAST